MACMASLGASLTTPARTVMARAATARGSSIHWVRLVFIFFTSFPIALSEAKQAAAVFSQLESFVDALGIALQASIPGERIGEVLEEPPHEERVLGIEHVVNPFALAARGDNPGLADGLKVGGKRG